MTDINTSMADASTSFERLSLAIDLATAAAQQVTQGDFLGEFDTADRLSLARAASQLVSLGGHIIQTTLKMAGELPDVGFVVATTDMDSRPLSPEPKVTPGGIDVVGGVAVRNGDHAGGDALDKLEFAQDPPDGAAPIADNMPLTRSDTLKLALSQQAERNGLIIELLSGPEPVAPATVIAALVQRFGMTEGAAAQKFRTVYLGLQQDPVHADSLVVTGERANRRWHLRSREPVIVVGAASLPVAAALAPTGVVGSSVPEVTSRDFLVPENELPQPMPREA